MFRICWCGAPGDAELCDVKSEERLEDPEFRAQVGATGLACAEAGFGYRVLSEPDRQLLVNVRWLAGFRAPPADPDGERPRMRSALGGGGCTIAELLAGARRAGAGAPGADAHVVEGRCWLIWRADRRGQRVWAPSGSGG